MQKPDRLLGMELIGLSNALRRQAIAVQEQAAGRLTAMQTMCLCYLAENHLRDVFQKDLEKLFQIRRSTATGILQVLEREGYLLRVPVPQDARLKKLVLTAKGARACEAAKQRIAQVESRIRAGLREEELTALLALIDRLRENLEDTGGMD